MQNHSTEMKKLTNIDDYNWLYEHQFKSENKNGYSYSIFHYK